MSTHAIDQPFRFTWGFLVVWVCLLPPAFILTRHMDLGPWYSQVAFFLVVPFLFTFAIYGPVLFLRAVIVSGARGWKVFRVLVSVLAAALVLFGGLLLSGLYTEWRARLLGGVFVAAATFYVNRESRRPPSVT